MIDPLSALLAGPAGLAICLTLIGVLAALELAQASDRPIMTRATRALWIAAAPLMLGFAAVMAVGLAAGGLR
jgi:hypothetical protein